MDGYLIYNTPRKDLNLLYWGHFDAPDPFWGLKVGDTTIAFVSELEYGRCGATSTFHEIYVTSQLQKIAKEQFPKSSPTVALLQYLQSKYQLQRLIIPNDFPAAYYAEANPHLPLAFDGPFFKTQRACKSASEISEIRKACDLTAETIQYAKTILKESTVQANEALFYQNQPLTSERLREHMESYCLQHGGYATDTIVAGGIEASNPHSVGSGQLYAQQLIVIDFFPHLQRSHYYGDMTRTVVKGNATPEQEKMYACVLECQKSLIQQIAPGVLTSDLQAFANHFFETHGYSLRNIHGDYEGFIHSVGHGIGLDLHEYPSVSSKTIPLKRGMVVTIEPGLYFKAIGGVRIEDDVLITDHGCEILTQCDPTWIL